MDLKAFALIYYQAITRDIKIYINNVHTYYIALHYITLHHITLHYIALHAYIYIQKYQHTYKVSLQYDMAYLISYNMNIIFIS